MARFFVITIAALTCLANDGAGGPRAHRGASDGGPGSASPRIVVVVSTKNPIHSLTAAELKRIFLRQKAYWPNGWPITVYERPVKEKIRQRFSVRVLDKKPEALHEYWMNLKLTRGLKPPKVLRSAKLVKRYLARVKGGVGYLYESELDDTVKAIDIVTGEEP